MAYTINPVADERHLHPAAVSALLWVQSIPSDELRAAYDALRPLRDDLLAQTTANTLERILDAQIVDEIDLLGLAWVLTNTKANRKPWPKS
jgi:hypothetical protein